MGFGEGGSRVSGIGVTVTRSSMYTSGFSLNSFVVRSMVVLNEPRV